MAAVEVPMGLCIGRKAARTSPSRPLTAKETGWELVCDGEKEDQPYDRTQLECVGATERSPMHLMFLQADHCKLATRRGTLLVGGYVLSMNPCSAGRARIRLTSTRARGTRDDTDSRCPTASVRATSATESALGTRDD